MREYEMTNYLNETYGGKKTNMLTNSAYYCYTILDSESGKYYSGSRGVEGSNKHDLLSDYFTSSTVVDFVEKLKTSDSVKFSYVIEYFETRSDAFEAEKLFHKKFNVGKNPLFINAINSGGSNCGAGSTLCRAEDGTIYRVSVEEYATGRHTHISSGMMNIRRKDGTLEKIKVVDFDPTIHTTEFHGYVMCIDTTTGKSRRISKEEFYSCPDRYVGITKGKVSAKNKKTGEIVTVSSDEFSSNGDLVGVTYGEFPVIDRVTGKTIIISKDEYDSSLHMHPNKNKMGVYSLIERKNVQISTDEYGENIDLYANMSTKCFYILDDIFFKSKNLLDDYYRKTRNGKSVLKVKQTEMTKKFPDIKVITKEQHQRGEY